MKNTVAVIVAHPDDEVLGCGGTIAKHVENGDLVHVLIMAEGITSRNEKRDVTNCEDLLENLHMTAKKANEHIGSSSLKLLNLPDNRMDSIDLLDIIKDIELFIDEYRPDIIYTHYSSDVNIDHQLVYDAVITATRPVPGQVVTTILCFEIVSSTEWQPSCGRFPFSPNWYIELTKNQLQKKILALEEYGSEMRDFPHARSIENIKLLAKWRGANVGVNYAESFVLARNILK